MASLWAGPAITLSDALAIALMAAAVYLPKAVPLLMLANKLPDPVQRWLRYIAPAVLGALVAPSILTFGAGPGTPFLRLLPFVVTLVLALRTRRMLPSVIAGLIALGGLAALRASG